MTWSGADDHCQPKCLLNGPKQSRRRRHVVSLSQATHDFRLERRLRFAVGNLLPVDSPEKLVALDVLLALLPAAQTLGGILDQKLQRRSGPNFYSETTMLLLWPGWFLSSHSATWPFFGFGGNFHRKFKRVTVSHYVYEILLLLTVQYGRKLPKN